MVPLHNPSPQLEPPFEINRKRQVGKWHAMREEARVTPITRSIFSFFKAGYHLSDKRAWAPAIIFGHATPGVASSACLGDNGGKKGDGTVKDSHP
ncbi:hypothetical protein CEXT_190961 [Caerostris extrusa]|uniref:Uncharacterized protein n=1 Tax=Caerostris extrusa TaxID=172846 RepID=A0AAV4QKF3_CAEEX|nr:hypothetical protein CEXT_190961 [Caerostris extrusa]